MLNLSWMIILPMKKRVREQKQKEKYKTRLKRKKVIINRAYFKAYKSSENYNRSYSGEKEEYN